MYSKQTHGGHRLIAAACRGLPLLLAAVFYLSPALAADPPPDPESRIRELEQQMQALSKELREMQSPSLALSKSKGEPLLGGFKDGIYIEDASGNWKLQLNGRVQADYRNYSPDAFAADTFSMRRTRLGVSLAFLKHYALRVEGEYAGGSTALTYGYLDLNWWKAAQIRIGQFKPSYGLERSMSANFIDFQERSLADNLLGATFDRGLMVYGTPLRGTHYSIAVVNGSGQNADDSSSAKDTMLRATGNAAEWVKWNNAVLHVGGFYGRGKQANGLAALSARTEALGTAFFTTANAFSNDIDRTRGGVELALAYGPMKLQGEYIRADYEGTNIERGLSAWYTSITWLMSGERYADAYKNGGFGRIKPKQNFVLLAEGSGAFELGVRYSQFDASGFTTANTVGTGQLKAGLTNEANAWTLGAKWILNPNARLMLNYVRTRFHTPVTLNGKTSDHEDALTMRAQLDF